MKRLALIGLLLLSIGSFSAHGATRPSTLAFWSDRGGLPGVWLMKPDGTGLRLLTGTKLRAKRADFSPNGRMLVFDGQPPRGETFDFDIQVIGVDGRGRKRLTRGPARDLEPRWSPDGKTIVFQRQYGDLGPPSIWTIRPSGTGLRRLAAGSSPTWSRDGGLILFSRETSTAWGSDIYRMKADGTEAGLFFRSPDDDLPGAYSPNGRRIAFTRMSRSSPSASIYVMNADGSAAQRLTPPTGFRMVADWSPDGRKILFTRILRVRNAERGQVCVMNADGSQPRNLSRNRFDENAESWSG
ncbi:MAG: PD40 domain-containing protein [Actinobacteria bacterium]|nr:PD40 domain-containing protein [Actinomycetota bacterium]